MSPKDGKYEAVVKGQDKNEKPTELKFTGDKSAGLARVINLNVRIHNRVDKTPEGKSFASDITCLYYSPPDGVLTRGGIFLMKATAKGMKCERHVVFFTRM